MTASEEHPAPRIVIVEDNNHLGELLQTRFSDEGWEAEHFSDAAPAAHHLACRPADFVILDVELGAGSGLDVLRSMRAGAVNQQTPAIMLTASRRGDDMGSANELGSTGYVIKPFNIERLVRRIDRSLAEAS